MQFLRPVSRSITTGKYHVKKKRPYSQERVKKLSFFISQKTPDSGLSEPSLGACGGNTEALNRFLLSRRQSQGEEFESPGSTETQNSGCSQHIRAYRPSA
jgi:hypothetical protein